MEQRVQLSVTTISVGNGVATEGDSWIAFPVTIQNPQPELGLVLENIPLKYRIISEAPNFAELDHNAIPITSPRVDRQDFLDVAAFSHWQGHSTNFPGEDPAVIRWFYIHLNDDQLPETDTASAYQTY